MNRRRKEGLLTAVILLILQMVFFGCETDPDTGTGPGTKTDPITIPEGINGFPETLTMGEPFDLRKNITINLPEAPDKTFDDIVWGNVSNGTLNSTQFVIEDDLFIPITFFKDSVTVFAIVKDGEGDGFDYTKTFQTNIVFPLNPFIGTWKGSDGKTWTFNKNGTYGIDSAADYGSFAVWSGKPGRKFLVTVSGDPNTITVESVAAGTTGLYTPYCFEQTGDTIKITPIEFDYSAYNKQDARSFEETGAPIILTRQIGEPAALDLSLNTSTSMMIGEWSAAFYNTIYNPSDASTNTAINNTITYYSDGRVAYSYEGTWLKRGNVFITVGNDGRRWDPPALASWDKKKSTSGALNGKDVVLINEYRPDGAGTPYSRGTNTSLYWRMVKNETDPGGDTEPADPYVPLVNPFTGVWKITETEYWHFKSDGTGGKASTDAGPLSDTFSFFVFVESQFYTSGSPKQSLVTLDDDGNITRYGFSIEQNNATLTPAAGDPITLVRVKGKASALSLTNELIGEYNATWSSSGEWSIKYRADGTARFYHRSAGHQFENGYALRGDTLVICGNMRFAANPIKATIVKQEDGTWKATETGGTTYYIYTKVDAAEWKE
jgi:hypothetical protein